MIPIQRWLGAQLVILAALCNGQLTKAAENPTDPKENPQALTANSTVNATTGNTASGSVVFLKTNQGVSISARFSGLTQGTHGFHIHEKGDCSSGDGKSAGGHFNPHATIHGAPDAKIRHVGDLGNIVADKNGNAFYQRVDKIINLDGPNSVVGRGIIIHAGDDDLVSQPTGAAGARIGCGVIE